MKETGERVVYWAPHLHPSGDTRGAMTTKEQLHEVKTMWYRIWRQNGEVISTTDHYPKFPVWQNPKSIEDWEKRHHIPIIEISSVELRLQGTINDIEKKSISIPEKRTQKVTGKEGHIYSHWGVYGETTETLQDFLNILKSGPDKYSVKHMFQIAADTRPPICLVAFHPFPDGSKDKAAQHSAPFWLLQEIWGSQYWPWFSAGEAISGKQTGEDRAINQKRTQFFLDHEIPMIAGPDTHPSERCPYEKDIGKVMTAISMDSQTLITPKTILDVVRQEGVRVRRDAKDRKLTPVVQGEIPQTWVERTMEWFTIHT